MELGFCRLFSILKSSEFLVTGILTCAVGAVIFTWIRKNKNIPPKLSGLPLPEVKVNKYSLYGNIFFPSLERIRKAGIPLTTYVWDNFLGHALIFRKEGLFSIRFGYKKHIFFVKPEYVEALLSSSAFLEKAKLYDMSHPWLGTGLLTSHGLKWKSRRKLLTRSFHFNILKDFLPTFDEQSKILVNILKEKAHKEWLDIGKLIRLCTLDIICETTLGVPICAQRNGDSTYVRAVHGCISSLTERMLNPVLHLDVIFWKSSLGRKFRKEIQCLHSFTRKVIQQKKDAIKSCEDSRLNPSAEHSSPGELKRKRKALMDRLLDEHMHNPELTEEGIREEIDTFVFEGHDTTSAGIYWTLYFIGLHPEIQKKLHNEQDTIFGDDLERSITVDDLKTMTYLECVVKESLRLCPSVPIFSRKAIKEFTLGGYRIEKGSTLIVSPFVVHRNPDAFRNPEKFDPDRFLPENCAERHPFAYIPFSAGPRNCIGQRFALMEVKTVISTILRFFHIKSLEQRDKIMLYGEIILRPVHPLKITFKPRNVSE